MLSGGYLTTNIVQTKNISVNIIALKKITCTSEIDKSDTKPMNESHGKLYQIVIKKRSKQMYKLNIYKYTSSNFYKDKVIHLQSFGHKREISYPPGEVFSKLMLTIYKPWIKDDDDFLDETIRNPKDSFSSNLCGYMLDEAFSKAIMMHILRAKIALDFQQTGERYFGLEHEYSPTLNRKNETMTGIDERDCKPINNLAQNNHMDLGETHF